VGNTEQLVSLTVVAASILMNGGGVATVFDQQYTGTMTLGAQATFIQGIVGGTLTFGKIVGATPGAFGLTVSVEGIAQFNGTVGGNGLTLQSITVNGPAALPSQAVTSGSQMYNGPVTFNSIAVLNSLAGDVTFARSVDSGGLRVTAPNGTITFGLAVGGFDPLSSLTVIAGHDVTGASVTAGQISVTGDTTTFTGLLHSTQSGGISLTGSNFSLAGVTVNVGTLSMNVSGTGTISGPVAGAGFLNKSGSGLLTLTGANTYTGSTAVSTGTLRVTGSVASSNRVTAQGTGTFEAAAVQTVRELWTLDTGKVVVSAGSLKIGNGTNTNPLAFAVGSTGIDLTTRGMILDYPSGNDQFVLVRTLIVSGLGTGTWNGKGIFSSSAAADPSTGVGYAQASDILGAGGGAFLGQTADGTSILARYTLLGDATLDGTVDFNDLVHLAQNYNGAGKFWLDGDFTYDGAVNFNDLVKLAQNYNSVLPSQPVPGSTAEFNADLARAFASVPEPGIFGSLIVLSLLGCRIRQMRRE
jgi:autotransporter-associated beta strand protein